MSADTAEVRAASANVGADAVEAGAAGANVSADADEIGADAVEVGAAGVNSGAASDNSGAASDNTGAASDNVGAGRVGKGAPILNKGAATTRWGAKRGGTNVNERQNAKRKMFGQVAKFGDDYTGEFPANSRGATLLSQLDAVMERIDRVAARPTGGSSGQLSKEQAFHLLEDLMEGLAETARTAARNLNQPQLRADLRLTPGASEQQWLDDAQRFLDRFNTAQNPDAPRIIAEFLDLEVQSDFVEKLGEYKKAVGEARKSQTGGTRTQSGATASLAADFSAGMAIANHLDTICENRYGRNPQTKDARKLHEWRQARHIEAPGDTKADAPATNPANSPA